MPIKDKLKKWLDDENKAKSPERYRLAERLTKDCDDEESAGLVNRLLDDVLGEKSD